ncbi:SidA/IucD/PvdA family monooxygenase [Halopseudomonas pachastrellae]|nr:SidA/IucD/PvdA family monooxygenase [Halopseudomonas pachastrellae]
MHSEQYRNADLLPEGNVLVVGSGQSGAQIAEDLHLAGRKVFPGRRRCAALRPPSTGAEMWSIG